MTELVITNVVQQLCIKALDYAYEMKIPPIMAIHLSLVNNQEIDREQFAWYCHNRAPVIFPHALIQAHFETVRLNKLEADLNEQLKKAFARTYTAKTTEEIAEEEYLEILDAKIGKQMQAMYDSHYGEPSLCVL
jgi:hypothetical protein